MKLRSNKVTKGIAFAGCSFTWGQGLWYYNNLPSTVEQTLNSYNPDLVHFTDRKAAHKRRFARLVADHFDTFEVVHYRNGGSRDAIVTYWHDHAFDKDDECIVGKEKNPTFRSYKSSDIDSFILQCTAWTRTDITLNIGGKIVGPMQVWDLMENHTEELNKYLQQEKISLDTFIDQCKLKDVLAYKDLLKYIDSLGIKTYVMTWQEDLVAHMSNDDYLASRMITFDYLGSMYHSIEKMIDNNSGLTLSTDYQNFEIPPTDNHPSLLCHKIIANNIITYIQGKK
jgi:hypothetical protein